MPVLESDIERACMRLAQKAGCILLKLQGSRGWPDRVLLCPQAQIAFLEFKRPGEQLRPLQAHIQSQLQAMGFIAERVDSTEQYKLILAGLLQRPGSHTTTSNAPSSG